LFEDARVVVATPQVVENDLVGSRVSMADVTHVTFDECHRATGDYAYTYIAERYHEQAERPLATGMSASPGDDEESILQICENLGLREVAVMSEGDADVAEFTHETSVDWTRVELPETVIEIRDALQEVITDRLTQLKELGVTGKTQPDMSERDIHEILDSTRGEIAFVTQPEKKFPVRIERIEPAAFPKEGENIFMVRCSLGEEARPWWRPGMSGLCKIEAGRRSLFWIFTHRTVDFLRMFFWW
jgi:ERCC4-related helicase